MTYVTGIAGKPDHSPRRRSGRTGGRRRGGAETGEIE